MAEPRQPRFSPPKGSEPRRPIASLAVSLLLNGALVALLVQALVDPSRLREWWSAPRPAEPEERVVYVQPPQPPAAAGVRGGVASPPDDEDEAPAPERMGVPLVAPTEVPTGIPAPPPGAPAGAPDGVPGGVPGGAGRGSPVQGLQPSYTDPRLWGQVQPAPSERRTTAQTVDSIITRDLEGYRDSLRRAAEARQPGDWTFDRGGQKWGIDPQYIRLGKVSIPTAILGLLPLNAQGNPMGIERDRALGATRRQIDNVERWQNANANLRDQAREIRERTDRERALRRERERIKRGEPPVASEPPDGQ